MNYPLISCLTPTHNRVNQLGSAINLFLGQTYPQKEMVIVCREGDHDTQVFIHQNQFLKLYNNITLTLVPDKYVIGEKRNVSVEVAKGEYIAIWDDDDWYDRNRLLLQMQAIQSSRKLGCLINQEMVFNSITKETHISHIRPWEHTLLIQKGILPKYPLLIRGSDTVVTTPIVKYCIMLPNPWLYTYIFHGNNIWPVSHFDEIANQGRKLTPAERSKLLGLMQNHYSMLI